MIWLESIAIYFVWFLCRVYSFFSDKNSLLFVIVIDIATYVDLDRNKIMTLYSYTSLSFYRPDH